VVRGPAPAERHKLDAPDAKDFNCEKFDNYDPTDYFIRMQLIRPEIPRLTVRRMTRYLVHLQGLGASDVQWVSSRELAESLGLTSSTVRQDLSYVDCCGISKRGYEVTKMTDSLAGVLGMNREWKMVVVGAGNLGRALALHEEFQRRNFSICGIFDNDPVKIGRKVGHLVIRSMRDIAHVTVMEKVNIGIIAVPAAAAQSAADYLIAAGVKGLLNLALTHIVAPRQVSIVDSRIITNLLELSHAIQTTDQRRLTL